MSSHRSINNGALSWWHLRKQRKEKMRRKKCEKRENTTESIKREIRRKRDKMLSVQRAREPPPKRAFVVVIELRGKQLSWLWMAQDLIEHGSKGLFRKHCSECLLRIVRIPALNGPEHKMVHCTKSKFGTPTIKHEFHETCHSVTFYFMIRDSERCCDTTTPESIHTKDESKRGSAFAFIFGVNWLVQWL